MAALLPEKQANLKDVCRTFFDCCHTVSDAENNKL